MTRRGLPIFLALGVSLFSVFSRVEIGPVSLTLAVSDVVLAVTLLYTLLASRRIIGGSVVALTLLLAMALLASGVFNAVTDVSFDRRSFLTNYLRIVGITAMVLLLPRLARKLGHDRLAHATLWVVRLHGVLILADSFVESPITWTDTSVVWDTGDPDHFRPRGLFGEPAWFAVYLAVSLFYILQVERNTGTRYLRPFDVILAGLVVVSSASIAAAGVLAVFLVALYCVSTPRTRIYKRNRRHVLPAAVALALLVALSATLSRDTGPGKTLEYFVTRVSSIQPQRFLNASGLQLVDSSTKQRLVGSALMVREILFDSPLLGRALGGDNVNRLSDRYVIYERDSGRVASLSLANMAAMTIMAGGIMAFIPIALIIAWMLRHRSTRLMGVGLVVANFLWGGAFEPVIWWYICLAVALRSPSTRQVPLSSPSRPAPMFPRHYDPRPSPTIG